MKTNLELMKSIANTNSGRLKRQFIEQLWNGTPIFPRVAVFKDNTAGLDELFEYSEEEKKFWEENI